MSFPSHLLVAIIVYLKMTEEIYLTNQNYTTVPASCQGAILDLWFSYDSLPRLPSVPYNFMIDIDGFTLWMYQRGLKERTIDFYTRSLKRLQVDLSDLTLESINAFLLTQMRAGKSTSYINDYVCSIKQYGKWKGIDFKAVKFIREKPTIKSTFSDKEIEEFLTLPPPIVKHMFHGKMHEYLFKPEKYHMWTLFYKIMAYSGMRCNEVATLTVEQVDFGRGVFIITDTKTNTPRYSPISSSLTEDLENYIKTLKGKYLFASKNGNLPSDVEWGRRFHERLTRLGIKRPRLTPYSFRHSFITRMLDEDVNLFKVQKIVGHKKIETTARYTHLTTKDIIKTIKKDPLSRRNLPFYDRMKQFREHARKLLEDYALDPEEEAKMLEALYK